MLLYLAPTEVASYFEVGNLARTGWSVSSAT
jgi:hypothetical protein